MNAHLRGGLRSLRAGAGELLAVRWVRVAAWLLAFAVALRVAAEPLLRFGLDRLAAQRDLTCTWEDLDLEVLAGRGHLTRLVVAPRGADGTHAQALVEIDYAVFDLDLGALLGGDVRVARAEIDGLTSRWVREADGRWNTERHVQVAELLELLEADAEAGQRPSEEPGPIDLSPPIAIDALRLQAARLELVDRTLEPPLELALTLDAALSDLRLPGRPARFSATLTSRGLVDGARVEGTADWNADAVRVEAWAHAAGLRAARLESYLAPFDLHAASQSIDARCEIVLALDVRGEARDTLGGELVVADVALSADGVEALALDALSVGVDAWSPTGAVLPAIEVAGPRGHVLLAQDGSVRLAGFAVTGDGWEEPAADWLRTLLPEMRGLPAWAALLVHADGSIYPWRLNALTVRDGSFVLEDRRLDPPARVPVLLDLLELDGLVHDPLEVERRIPLRVEARVPGVLASATLSGSLDPFAPARHVDLALTAEGIDPAGLDGYLRRLGLEHDLADGRFELALEGDAVTDGLGRTEGRLEVRGVSLRGESDLFGVERLAVEGVVVDPDAHLLKVGELSIEGPRLALGRDPSQRFFALGLRTLGLDPAAASTVPTAAGASEDAPTAAAAASASTRPPLRVELDRVRWAGTRVTLMDALRGDGGALLVDELSFELEGLVLDGDPDAPVPEPARLRGRVAADGVVDALELEGTLSSQPGRLDLGADLALRGSGLGGGTIAPYLRPLGIEPSLESGELALDLRARLTQDEALQWRAELGLDALRLADGGRTLLALERLAAADVRLGEVTRVGSLEVAGLRAAFGRDADGALHAPGLRVLPAESGASVAAEDAPAALVPRLPWPALPPLELERVLLSDVELSWDDALLQPALSTRVALGFEGSALGTLGTRGAFEAVLSIPETLERLGARGELGLGRDALELTLALEAEGLRGGPLTRLLPPGLALEPEPSALRAAVRASARPLADDGLALRLEARDVALTGAGAHEPWLALHEGALALALEPATDTLRVEEARAVGLDLAARRDAEGALHALGLRLSAVPADGVVEAAAAGESAPPSAPRALPRVALDGPLALERARLRFRDDVLAPGAEPFAAELQLRAATPVVLVSPDVEELTPLGVQLELGLPGLLERLDLEAQATPFAQEPAFDVGIAARGLRTAGLVERLPALAERAEGTVDAGTFDAHIEGTLALRRSSPTDPGLARPFSAELELSDVALRAAPGGEVLLGVDRVAAELREVDLARGLVHVSELEIERPRAHVARRADGRLHVAGLALSLDAPAATTDGRTQAPHDGPTLALAVQASAPAPVDGSAGGELRIDRVLVSGIDVRLEDEAVEPAMRVPLTELEVEVSGLSTRLLEAPGDVRFDLLLAAGAGAAADAAPVFEELAASGRVALFPAPNGRAQISLTGLTLTEFAGLAAQQGLRLDDGALDARTRLRLSEDETLRVDTSLGFSDLDLSEPEGGWLERTLSLPVALDTALFLLRNADGEHAFSTGLTLDAEGVSSAQIAGAAARAFAEVLAGALAGAPLRLLGALVPGGEEEPAALETWEFEFDAGLSELEPALLARIDEAARHLEANPRHVAVLESQLAADDLARATVLANPAPQDVHHLVADLRGRRAELAREHARLVAQARVERALGESLDAAASEGLRQVGRERAEVERSLDLLLEILRSDQPRRRERRARVVLREIAELRLEGLRAALELRLEPSARERLELRAPRAKVTEDLERGRVVLELRAR